MKNKIIREY